MLHSFLGRIEDILTRFAESQEQTLTAVAKAVADRMERAYYGKILWDLNEVPGMLRGLQFMSD